MALDKFDRRKSMFDTFQFVEGIKDFNALNKTFSLDITSLFTSMPLTETVCCVCDYIAAHNLDVGLPTSCLKELLLRCTFNVQFSFNNQIYRQKDGIVMGSPLGPLLADFFHIGTRKFTTSSNY
ncbi:unnamed protein product [Heterobilharzia americana]|nr:unnamed protein product [Heterobilharzia americana]CAH8573810.1 unnamed protein product [Heterobilharzia americana]